MAENRDRSSMADFVRILQAYDQAQYGISARQPAMLASRASLSM